MGMAPIIYRYDDPGSPALSSGDPDGLRNLLIATLIHGYGSKPAAGWSVVHDAWSSDGVLTITNQLQTGVIGLYYHGGSDFGPHIFVADAMVSSTEFVNARSGRHTLSSLSDLDALSNTQRAYGGGGSITKWVVIANNNACFIWFGSDRVLFDCHTDGSANQYLYFVGFGAFTRVDGLADDAVGNMSVWGGTLSQYQSSSSSMWPNDRSGNIRSTIFYSAGVLKTGNSHMVTYPFAVNQSDHHRDTGYLPLAPVLCRDYDDSTDIFVVNQFYSSWTICSASSTQYFANIQQTLLRHFSADLHSLDGVVTKGGKDFLFCCCGHNSYAFVSMDPADWL